MDFKQQKTIEYSLLRKLNNLCVSQISLVDLLLKGFIRLESVINLFFLMKMVGFDPDNQLKLIFKNNDYTWDSNLTHRSNGTKMTLYNRNNLNSKHSCSC